MAKGTGESGGMYPRGIISKVREIPYLTDAFHSEARLAKKNRPSRISFWFFMSGHRDGMPARRKTGRKGFGAAGLHTLRAFIPWKRKMERTRGE